MHARHRTAAHDAAFEAFLCTPDGPERVALARRMSDVVIAFGFTWKYMDIDLAKKKAAGKSSG